MDRVSIISLLVGSVLPLLTAAVTKASWPEWLKQLLLALLSTLTGVGVELQQSGGPAASVVIANAATAFATAVAVAAGTWKPTGAVARLEALFVRDTPGKPSNTDTQGLESDTSPTQPTPNTN